MTTESDEPSRRSYGCSFGCGNPYDYIMIDVMEGETLFACVPCFIKQAVDMVTAFTDPESPEAARAATMLGMAGGTQPPGPSGRKRGHNAPAASDDTGLFEQYDSVVTIDELPPEFR